MTYDCLDLRLRTPGHFNCAAFVMAIQKVLWEKCGCDKMQTGVMSYQITPDGGVESPFAYQQIQMVIRAETGKVPIAKFTESVRRYLLETLHLDVAQCYVADLKVSPDVLRSEL